MFTVGGREGGGGKGVLGWFRGVLGGLGGVFRGWGLEGVWGALGFVVGVSHLGPMLLGPLLPFLKAVVNAELKASQDGPEGLGLGFGVQGLGLRVKG